jgi:heme exporter protein CcmD
MAASHFSFVATAYGFAAIVLAAIIAWIAADYRAQKSKLAELEAKRGKK